MSIELVKYKILALDPGTRLMGWCVGQAGYLSSGVLGLQPPGPIGRTIWDRIHEIGGFLKATLASVKPDVVGVEWPMGRGGNAAKIKLGMVLGAIALEAGRAGVPVLEINPQEIKRTDVHKDALVYAAAIAGRAVRKDEADAIGCYLALDGKLTGLTLQEAVEQWGKFWSTR